MTPFGLITPVIYWVLVFLWAFILFYYLKKLRYHYGKPNLIFTLLMILSIDAFRTLFESLYFGLWNTALAGFLPIGVHAFLIQPQMVFIPKILNLIAGIAVVFLLLFRWLPQEEREKMENELQFHSIILDRIHDHVTATDLDGKIIYVNEASIRTLKRAKDEVIGQFVSIYGENPSKGATQQQILENTLQHGTWRGEVVNYAGDGTEIIMDCRTQLIEDNSGAAIAMVGIATDMTENKKIAQKIIESEMSLRSIFKVLPDLLFQIDEDMRFVNVQTSNPEQLLAPIDQIIGKHTYEILPDNIAALTKQKYHEAMKNGGVELYYYHLTIHGEERAYETRMVPCTENSVLAIVRDVTDIKKYERKIKESEGRYNAIVNEQTDLVCRFLPDLRLIFVNKAYCHYFGRSQDELIGHSFLPLIPEKDRLRVQNDILSLGPGKEVITHDHEVIQEGGEVRHVEWTARILHCDTPEKIEYQGVGRDITERKRLQNKLMALSEREQRYFAQELHDGLCQDLKGLEIEIALMEGRLRDVSIDYAQMAQSIGQQVNSAVKKAYSIAHGMLPFELDVKSFGTALIDLAEQAGNSHDQKITVSIDKDLLPKSESHAYHLYRIAQEAVYNALNHGKATEIILFWCRDSEGVFLSIHDNGIGMDVALSKKSKGMGLIVIQSRAEGIGATLTISSTLNEGTTVLVRFPVGSV